MSSITEANIYPDFDGFARLHAHNKPHIEPDAQSYMQRGIEAHQNNNLDDAITYYTEVISLDSDHSIIPQAYHNRGNAYYFKGEYDRAIADYDKTIELNPNEAQTYYNRGNAYYSKGAYDRAITDYNNAIILNPRFAQAYHSRGNAYYVKGAYDLAIADYNNAIKWNPNDAQAYHSRGYTYYIKGAYDRAIADYNNTIVLNPDEAQAYNNRGMCWLHLQNWQGARSDLTIAKNKGMDIIAVFRDKYKNVGTFEQQYSVKLPEDIAVMLTQG